MQLSRVLYATDFSRCASQALPHAVRFAERFGAELHVLHAVVMLDDDPHNPAAHLPDAAAVAARLATLADEKMSAALAGTTPAGLAPSVRQVQRRGVSATRVILEYADEIAADLVVLGTHGREGLGRLFLGSVAEDVVRRSSCPVLTVREHEPEATYPGVRKILVPVDFSPGSKLAVWVAQELASRFGATLQLLHVVDEAIVPDFYLEGRVVEPIEAADLRARARQRLAEAVEQSGGPRVPFETFAVEGRAWRAIVDFADETNADLVVMSADGLGGLGGMLVGKVTERVVRAAACPVLTLKSAWEAGR